MHSKNKMNWVFLSLAMSVALALRLDFLFSDAFIVDSDEAIVGLMAKHISEGLDLPVFYYGQHYMGSLEPLVTALFFYVWGPSAFLLKLVPLLFSLVLVFLVYCLTLEISSERAAKVAAILCAIAPNALIVWSAKARGGFIEIVVIGALAFLFLIRWLKAKELRCLEYVLFSFLLGVGWWVNNQIVYFFVPVGIAVLARLIAERNKQSLSFIGSWWFIVRQVLVGGVSFLIGGLPYWWYNLNHNFASFGMFHRASKKEAWQHLQGVVDTALPILLGGKRFWHDDTVFPNSSLVIGTLWILPLFVLLWTRRKELLACLRFKIDLEHPIELFVILLASGALIFSASSYGWLFQAPRYLLPVYVSIFVLGGVIFELLARRLKTMAILWLLAILSLNIVSSYTGGRAIPGEPYVFSGERVSKNHDELYSWLKDKGVSWIRTNYWIGYRIAFDTNEAVRFVVTQEPYQVRIPDWQEVGERLALKETPFVMVPSQGQIIRAALDKLGYHYGVVQLSGYEVIYGVEPVEKKLTLVELGMLQAVASYHEDAVSAAIDGDVGTRWGSATPQRPGMVYELRLKEPMTLRGLSYALGKWPHDYPRGLKIEIEREDGVMVSLVDPESWGSIRYFMETSSEFTVYFRPEKARRIVLTQTGNDAVFDWSIAEIRLWQ